MSDSWPSVVKSPFGGSLHLLVNHKKAFEAPLQHKYYQVKLTKVGSSTFKIFSDPFSDLVWTVKDDMLP